MFESAAAAAPRRMVDSLSPHWRAGIGAPNDDLVHDGEAGLLYLVAALQQDRGVPSALWHDMAAAGREGLLHDSAKTLATHLAALGHRLPSQPHPQHWPQHWPRARAVSPGAPGRSTTVGDRNSRGREEDRKDGWTRLNPTERWLVGAVRYWVRRVRDGAETVPALEWQFAQIGQPAAVIALHGFLSTLAAAASRTIDVHCPNCRQVSSDEAGMLAAVSALQRDDGGTASGILGVFLPASAVRQGNGHLAVLAAGLTAAGLILPVRHWVDQSPDDQAHTTETETAAAARSEPGGSSVRDLAAWFPTRADTVPH